MKKMWKYFSMLVALCLMLSCIGIANAAETEPLKLTVWCWSPNDELLETGAAMFQSAALGNVELETTVMALADVRTKIATITSSGDLTQLPDMILMQDSSIPMMVHAYGEAFLPLSDYGIDTSTLDHAKIAWDTFDNRLWGIPFDSSVGVVCYRTDYLAEAGYTIDDMNDISWEEFRKIAGAVLEKTGHPLLSTSNDTTMLTMMLMSAGGSLFNADGTPNLSQNEKLKAVIAEYQALVESGTLKVVNNWDEYMSSINSGSCGGTMNGMWIMNSCMQAPDQSGNWGVANIPAVSGVEGASNYASSGGSSWMITANCKEPEKAVAFLMTLMGGELSDSFYASILTASNYISAYLPTAANSSVYGVESEFFGGQKVYEVLGSYVEKMPVCNTSYVYDETQDALAVALSNILGGANMQAELDAAQSTVDFLMY